MRIHLFEFHDLPWFPATFRDALTEWLRVLWAHIDAYKALAPVIADVLDQSHATRIVDLCSGGSGPLLGIQKEFEAAGRDFRAIVTDKFPNLQSMKELQTLSGGRIEACLTSVDATRVPSRLQGFRTLFNSFHHFPPAQARAILRDACEAGQPIGIFEVPNHRFQGLAFSFIATFLGVLVLTPTMRPRRPVWWLFTYLLPVIPFIVAWDGWVSHLRAYTPDQILEMTRDFPGTYTWQTRLLELRNGQFIVTCFIGLPPTHTEER